MAKRKSHNSEDYWMSISDMMAGLMIIFMFIAISYMLNVREEKQQIEDIAEKYALLKENLYIDLTQEFEEDFEKWNAELDRKSLSIRFKEPEVFFESGESRLKRPFKDILSDFFPRYISILNSPNYNDEIEEVRIEGHTSSEWGHEKGGLRSYYNNMELSQERTRSVLMYVMNLDSIATSREWLMKHMTANGLSFSHRIIVDGKEDYKKSRRVEFRVRTKAEKHIDKILENRDKGAEDETN